MTSQEQPSTEHALVLNQAPSSSRSADRDGNKDSNGSGEEVELEIRDGEVDGEVTKAESEVEDVGVGVAVTTAEDDKPVGVVVVLDDEPDPRLHSHSHPGLHPHPGSDRAQVGASAASLPFMSVARHASSSSSASMRRVVSSSRFASRSQSAMGSVSVSMSYSQSHSRSRSQSQSHSSLKRALEMGESSSATSWNADVEGLGGERPSGDNERRRPGDDEAHYRSDADGPVSKEVAETGEREERVVVVSRTEARSRLGANKSTETGADRDASRKEVVLVTQEEDIAEGWRPSRHHGKAPLQDDENEKGLEEEDVGSVHALESLHGGDRSSETNEKERWQSFGSTGRNSRRLHLEFKRPLSHSWDDGDPPTDRNDIGTSDYYSTLNSKKFEAMQKSRQRPLIPHSSYYFGPPPPDSAYGTHPVGQIGVHHPREIVRIERDYVGGELIQFTPVFPLELEGRITPTQFHQTINDINEILISAHSIQHTFVDNILAVLTLQLSTLVLTSHYTKEMRRLKRKIEEFNTQVYNPVGLHILWPKRVAFLFLEIEYY